MMVLQLSLTSHEMKNTPLLALTVVDEPLRPVDQSTYMAVIHQKRLDKHASNTVWIPNDGLKFMVGILYITNVCHFCIASFVLSHLTHGSIVCVCVGGGGGGSLHPKPSSF